VAPAGQRRLHGAEFVADGVRSLQRNEQEDTRALSPADKRGVNAVDQAPCVCDGLAETSHPWERRSQTRQRRNIEPRSHETQ
jgi:hypothetical protein